DRLDSEDECRRYRKEGNHEQDGARHDAEGRNCDARTADSSVEAVRDDSADERSADTADDHHGAHRTGSLCNREVHEPLEVDGKPEADTVDGKQQHSDSHENETHRRYRDDGADVLTQPA